MIGVPVYKPAPFLPFDEVLFPTNISYQSAGGPEFLTELTELGGGTERADARLATPGERWNIAYGVRNEDDVDELMRFFLCRRGRAAGFYFQIPNDHRVEEKSCGVADGYQDTFPIPLTKDYVSGARTMTRTRMWIYDPASVEVTVDGVVCSAEDYPYTLDLVPSGGNAQVTFTEDLPPEGSTVRASFDFVIKARFDTDFMPSRLEDYKAESAEVPVVEIIPPAEEA